jgi:phosphatidylglycerol:prolipoprotein diacylglycerol transferase
MHPHLFSIGNFELRIYSLMLIIAVFVGLYFSSRRAKSLGYDGKLVENAAIASFAGGILGARLYFVIFNWDFYSANPGEILQVWHGGLAIHGGIILGIISAFIFCRLQKFSLITLGDLFAPFIILGQGLGRIGNFANGEAHGVPTLTPPSVIFQIKPAFQAFWQETLYVAGLSNTPPSVSTLADKIPMTVEHAGKAYELKEYVPWGVSFPPTYNPAAWQEFGTLPVHPTFFYEMILNFIAAAILVILWRKDKNIGTGTVFALYLVFYGLIRGFVTFFRADDLMFGPLRAPHLASIGLLLAAILWYRMGKKKVYK